MKRLKEKTLFLLDMDGTIYHENELIDGTLDFFQTLVRQGKDYAFMTLQRVRRHTWKNLPLSE